MHILGFCHYVLDMYRPPGGWRTLSSIFMLQPITTNRPGISWMVAFGLFELLLDGRIYSTDILTVRQAVKPSSFDYYDANYTMLIVFLSHAQWRKLYFELTPLLGLRLITTTNFTLKNHALMRIDEFYSGESRSGESTNFTLENHALANHCTQLLSMSLSVQYASLISSLNQLNWSIT
jgi:hypothetical protein